MDLTAIDWAFLAVVVLSIVVGAFRGLIYELLSLVGWVVGYIAAHALTPWVSTWFPVGEPGTPLNHGASFACTFIAALIVWGLLTKFVRALVQAVPLVGGLDRLLGAAFGCVRALVVLLVIATVIAWSPARNSPQWAQSRAKPLAQQAFEMIRPWLPSQTAREVKA